MAMTQQDRSADRSEVTQPRSWMAQPLALPWVRATALAWVVGLPVMLALEPTPQPGAETPLIGQILTQLFFAGVVAMGIGLATRHRWGMVASLATAGVVTASAVACPVTGHHAFGLWWAGQLAICAGLLAVSLACLGSRAAAD
jgi:hypothetical protein